MDVLTWLRDVDFSDPKNGWIVGGFGLIYYTEDGGKTWLPVARLITAGKTHHERRWKRTERSRTSRRPLLARRQADRVPPSGRRSSSSSSPALFAYWAFQLQPGDQLRRPAAAGPPVHQDPQPVLRHLRRRQQHHRHARGEGRHDLHPRDAEQDLEDDRGPRQGLRRQPQPDRLDRPPHRALPQGRRRRHHARPAGDARAGQDARRKPTDDPPHRPQRREHLRPAGLARRQGGADPRQLHRGPARLPAHLQRGQRQRRQPVRATPTPRSTSPASRASTAGSTTTPATSSSSWSSPTASSGCCAGCTSTTGAARCGRRSPG